MRSAPISRYGSPAGWRERVRQRTFPATVNIARLRLASQHIARPILDEPAAVVRRLGAVQAQDYLGALWGVGLRMRGATEASVEDAVARGAIVRTWPMRGTLHFVAAEDVRWMLSLLTPRVIAASAGRYRQLELDAKLFARAGRLAERALAGGKPLRRTSLYAIWNAAGIATEGARGLHIVGYLAQTGLVSFGPRDGRQPTFVLLDEWVRTARRLAGDEALTELARRYYTSHGPATVHDLAWWAGLTVAEARTATELAKPHLSSETGVGRTYWLDPTVSPAPGAGVGLLPAWDEYTVAYRDRTDIVAPEDARRVNTGGGILRPVVVARGQVVGTWRRTLRRGVVAVTPELFGRPGETEARAIAAASRRYGRFLGLRAAVDAQTVRGRNGPTQWGG